MFPLEFPIIKRCKSFPTGFRSNIYSFSFQEGYRLFKCQGLTSRKFRVNFKYSNDMSVCTSIYLNFEDLFHKFSYLCSKICQDHTADRSWSQTSQLQNLHSLQGHNEFFILISKSCFEPRNCLLTLHICFR